MKEPNRGHSLRQREGKHREYLTVSAHITEKSMFFRILSTVVKSKHFFLICSNIMKLITRATNRHSVHSVQYVFKMCFLERNVVVCKCFISHDKVILTQSSAMHKSLINSSSCLRTHQLTIQQKPLQLELLMHNCSATVI